MWMQRGLLSPSCLKHDPSPIDVTQYDEPADWTTPPYRIRPIQIVTSPPNRSPGSLQSYFRGTNYPPCPSCLIAISGSGGNPKAHRTTQSPQRKSSRPLDLGTWQPVSHALATLSFCCKTIDPRTPHSASFCLQLYRTHPSNPSSV